MFQFHNGTINTLFNEKVKEVEFNKFQFHNGTINTEWYCIECSSCVVSIPQRYN